MAPPRIADQLGRVLGGRYRLAAPLGTGASAHVYVADDVRLRRRVAVKVLHPALAQDETFLRRFRSEAQAVAALRHPHVMQVFDWGEDGDGPYLVLEYLSGGSLRDLLDEGHRLSPSQALLVGMQAAQALEYAHRRGLVHRDIKPANLLFDDEGRVAIADFGLARALAEAAWTEPAGAIVGTARYASPEQARGSRVDGRADVYALALVLVEAVTGRVPFAADTTIATLMARVDRDLEPPEALGVLGAAIEGAGKADPEQRIDAAEFVHLLDGAAIQLPAPAPVPIVRIDRGPALASTFTAGARDESGRVDDLTVLPPGPAAASVPAASTTARPRLFDREAAPAAVHGEPAPPRTRRWGRRILVALVAVLIVAALTGGALVATGATKARHAVPELGNLTVAEARRSVADEHFKVVERDRKYDENVAVGRILSQSPLGRDRLREGEAIRVVVSKGPEPRKVPDLTEKTADQAKQLVEAQRLVFQPTDGFSDTVPKGSVVDWSPKGDVARGSAVAVTISKGPQPKPIPTFADRARDAVRRVLEALGFKVKEEEAFSDDVAKGQVIGTRPDVGTEAQPGDEVTIIVSKGPDVVTVPDVSGMGIGDADAELRKVGLFVSGVDGSPFGTVRSSRPRAGSDVKRNTGVVVVTNGRGGN